jgi:UV DNA damage endonuclease
MQIPMVYDVHHHRCLPDNLTEEEVTKRVVNLWNTLNRETYFHLSSPKHGWHTNSPNPHADYINPADFPACWKGLTVTVDIEAKAKELAILKLRKDLKRV